MPTTTPVAVTTDILPPRYRDPQRIGHGGMGDIYRATDTVLGRDVAIKVLADRYAADGSVRERFTREALAAARLSSEPNMVTIFDVGEHAGRPYIVMEYLGGGSLDDGFAPGRRSLARAHLHMARAGGTRTGRRAPRGSRPSRRQAREPHARPGGQRARRRLRYRERHRPRLADDDRDRARHGRVPLARAGAGRACHAGQRSLRARSRRVRTAHGVAAVRRGQSDCRGCGTRECTGSVDLGAR